MKQRNKKIMLSPMRYNTKIGFTEKDALHGGMTETRLGIPAPMGDNYLSSIGQGSS